MYTVDLHTPSEQHQAQVIHIAPGTVGVVQEIVKDEVSAQKLMCDVTITIGAHACVTYEFATTEIDHVVRTITLVLEGEYAQAQCIAAYQVQGTARHELYVRQMHTAAHTKSSSGIKMVLKDQANVIYRGYVYIDPQAHQANAVQDYKALILSPQAKISAQPELEILHDKVACKHGVAIGQINKEHLFYGMSRGLDIESVTKLITDGFLIV